MVGDISLATRTEVLGAIRSRYRQAQKKVKSRMLDEFVAITGCHRKHAVRLLGQWDRLRLSVARESYWISYFVLPTIRLQRAG